MERGREGKKWGRDWGKEIMSHCKERGLQVGGSITDIFTIWQDETAYLSSKWFGLYIPYTCSKAVYISSWQGNGFL